jgi:glycine/D-amino acid oxidase-like deaminating enzyme
LITSAVGKAALNAREKAALEKWRGELARLEEQLEILQESLVVARRTEEAKQAAAEKKTKQAAEQAAADAHMSEAGACELVELVMLRMNARFVNKSDTVDAVWAHVHKEFMKLVEKGDLPATDARPVAALKLK